MEVDFTGERFIPEKTSKRITDEHFSRYRFALQFVQGKKVLDFACGSGYGSFLLRKEGGAVYVDGADISQELVDYAKSHFQAEGVSFFVDNLTNHRIQSKYDVVTCFETIEHVDNYQKALKNLYALLNHNGVLIISTPNRLITAPKLTSLDGKPDNPFHTREFILPELKEALTQAGFNVHPDDIYGQRQQKYFKNRYLRRLYKLIFRPDIRYSPVVARLYAQPRSLVIVARKY